MVKFCLLFILLKIKKKKSFLCLPALCQSVRLYCEVIQPLSLGVEWWNKSHSTGSLSLLCLHFAAAALVQSASACMTFIVLLIGELHLLIIKRNIYRIAHAHVFFFFFAFVCLCVCMYVSRQALNQANSSPSRCHGYLAVRLGVMATRQQTNHSNFAHSLWLLPAGSAAMI